MINGDFTRLTLAKIEQKVTDNIKLQTKNPLNNQHTYIFRKALDLAFFTSLAACASIKV